MPLERRVRPPRTYQRTYRGNTRQQPYTLPTSVPEIPSGENPTEVQTAESGSEQCAPTGALTKRHGSCTCRPFNGSVRRNDRFSDTLLGNVAEETQRILPDQWSQTNENQTRRIEGSSRFTSDYLAQTSAGNTSPALRNLDSISSEPNTSATSAINSNSMIPNTVPIPSAHSVVSNFDVSSVPSYSHSSEADIECSMREVVQNLSVSVCGLESDSAALSNHDRCAKERCASSQQDHGWSSTITPLRLRARSMPAMPPPSPHARQVANRVIKHARDNKTPDERALWCPDCRRLPALPVTGQCGHTRCKNCIEDHGACPCGVQAPKTLHVNTLIQDLIRKMSPNESCSMAVDGEVTGSPHALVCRSHSSGAWRVSSGSRRGARVTRRRGARPPSPASPPRVLLTPQSRFELAKKLVAASRHSEAAPHLARVAASCAPLARLARTLLTQAITALSEGRDARRLTRRLYRAVRAQSAAAWLKRADLECVLCYHAYTSPVSTPCGHTYCRTCIERSMDYRKSCALCLRPLDDFDLAATGETVFVCAALASIDALNPPPPPDPDVIPIFVCTVAYPAIPCPLFIFDPRYWLMIRRVLESGSRKFGMVAYERDRSYSDYGTVLEVCDCVHFEDGRSILSTVGVSRFRVIERDVRDGCDVARIQPLTDITPTEELVIWELRLMATQISYKALLWLNSMNRTVRAEIETAFGQLPLFDQEDWWESSDGPAWLWWLIAILPLRSEIKILILSTKNLLKRMMAVSRTLEAIDQVAISASATSVCELRSALTNAEEWLERST